MATSVFRAIPEDLSLRCCHVNVDFSMLVNSVFLLNQLRTEAVKGNPTV